jgi:hypothetical protein
MCLQAVKRNSNDKAHQYHPVSSQETVRTIDRMAPPGQRSRFIERAVQHYVATASPEALEERLKQAAIRDRDLDLEIANDWFAVDQEEWRRLDTQSTPATRKGAKSTSRRSPDRRARNRQGQAGSGNSERHHQPVRRDYHGGADHLHGASTAISSACPAAG